MNHMTCLAATALLLGLVPAAHGAEPRAAPAPGATPAPLQALSDTELRSVVRPAAPSVVYLPLGPAKSGWFRLLQPGARQEGSHGGLPPFLSAFPLSADIVARDVDYGANSPVPRMNLDGSMTLPLPLSIGELDIQNIRAAPGDTSSFGAIQIKGLDFGRTSIIVTPGK